MLTERSKYAMPSDFSWNPNPQPRKCARCGEEYMPRSRSSKYCDACRTWLYEHKKMR